MEPPRDEEAEKLLVESAELTAKAVQEKAASEATILVLQQKLAASETKVKNLEGQLELRKVASFSPDLINQTVKKLVDHNFLAPENQEKIASRLRDDPEAIFDVLGRMIEIHESPTPSIGAGVKRAAEENKQSQDSDPENWQEWLDSAVA